MVKTIKKAERAYNKAKKTKLGSGKRFSTLSALIQKKSGVSKDSSKAIAAAIGRKKYGKKKMTSLATKGKRNRAK